MNKPDTSPSAFSALTEKNTPQSANPKTPAPMSPLVDPDEYDWVPIPRRKRRDGWTPLKQRAFIEALADGGSVSGAAREVGMSKQSCYALRRSKDGAPFAAAWDAAIGQASRLLADVAFDRAINGTEHHVIDREGNHIYTHTKTNDRLLMFLLRSHQPQVYGRGGERAHAREDSGENIADAVEKLVPPAPEGAEAEAAVREHLPHHLDGKADDCETGNSAEPENHESAQNKAS